MTSVMRNVFRYIEKFVQETSKPNLSLLTPDEVMMMRSPLAQARDWLYR
jgi:hypothetical protein